MKAFYLRIIFPTVFAAMIAWDVPLQAQGETLVPLSITTFAGTANPGSTDGASTVAQFDYPYALAVDGYGNIYVADSNNQTIRKITSDGIVTTLAGNAGVFGSDDGIGKAALFSSPQGVASDNAGNIFVTDTNNQTVRKITADGEVTTLAGTAGVSGAADGTGGAAQFDLPSGIAADGSGNIYVADSNNQTIRKITSTGVVTTLAGTPGLHGSADGMGSTARFSGPQGVAVDKSGNVYVADSNNQTIRKIGPDGTVTTLAGEAGKAGSSDGLGSAARFYYPFNLAVDASGNIYVADLWNSTIRKITPAGLVTTLAGKAGIPGSADGSAKLTLFSGPRGVAVNHEGDIFVADTGNNTIRSSLVSLIPGIPPSDAVVSFTIQ